jgi:hypothetical protein
MHASMSETYNGWKNRTTWALNLWLANDQDSYTAAREWAQHASEVAERDGQAAGAAMFARLIRDNWHAMPSLMRIDVGNDLSQVDWAAVMESFLEE